MTESNVPKEKRSLAERLRASAQGISLGAEGMGWGPEDLYIEAANEIERLDALINTPHTAEFLESVKLEAIHQRERWGSQQDSGKTDADWFWLVGYLAGKALHKPEKQVHHIITTAAALLNWHAAATGADNHMRPGIEPPKETMHVSV